MENVETKAQWPKRRGWSGVTEFKRPRGKCGSTLTGGRIKVKEKVARQSREKTGLWRPIVQKPKAIGDTGVIVEGLDNCMVKFAKCCMPIPGDSTVGFITRGYGVSVHRTDCPNVQSGMKKDGEEGRWIRTEWDYTEKHLYQTGLRVSTHTRVGIFAEVGLVFCNAKINVNDMHPLHW